MSVNNIRDNIITASNSKAWKNLLINDLKCKSLSVDDGIIANGIENTTGDILFDTTAPLNNQGLIYNSSTGKIEFKTLIDNTGITNLNSCVGLVQSFSINNTTIGNGFGITSNPLTNTHEFNICDAGPSSRGFINTLSQQIIGQKTFLNDILCGTTATPRVLYTNNIMSHNSGANTMDITGARVNINCSDALYVDRIRSVDRITGENSAYLEFIDETSGAPPSIRAVSNQIWQLGASHSSDLNRQISIGYSNIHGGGLIYAYNQASSGGGPMQLFIGYPSFPSNTTLSGSGFTHGNRPIVSGSSAGNANSMFAASIDLAGGVQKSSGGIAVTYLGTGIYKLVFDCNTVYGVSASINESSQNGYITVENTGLNECWIITRNNISVGTNLGFNVTAFGYKA